VTPEELLATCDGVIAQARSGEQVEAVATWSRETEARAYDGAVEAFTSAESAGIGVRVIADHRAGFAWAGTFEPSAISDVLAEARDNASFASPDPFAGLAEPDGVAVVDLQLFDERLAATSTDDKIAMVIDLEAAILAADRRISGVESVEYADETACAAVVSTAGIRTSSIETACSLAAYILASEGDETTTGFGFSVGRYPGELNAETTTADAVNRAVRMLGARPARSERLTIVLDPGSPPSSSASWPASLPVTRCSRAGRSSPAGWASRSPRRW
jgi:PmbA protein